MKLCEKRYRKQGGLCFFCSEPFSFTDMTIDHFIPRSLGGSNGWANKVMSCQPCNVRKGNRMPYNIEKNWYRVVFNMRPPKPHRGLLKRWIARKERKQLKHLAQNIIQ